MFLRLEAAGYASVKVILFFCCWLFGHLKRNVRVHKMEATSPPLWVLCILLYMAIKPTGSHKYSNCSVLNLFAAVPLQYQFAYIYSSGRQFKCMRYMRKWHTRTSDSRPPQNGSFCSALCRCRALIFNHTSTSLRWLLASSACTTALHEWIRHF